MGLLLWRESASWLVVLVRREKREEKSFSSVAVQTVPEESGVFALRQNSLSSSDTSGVCASGDEVTMGEEEEEEGKRGEDKTPRPVAECLSIFQSDVSLPSYLPPVQNFHENMRLYWQLTVLSL